MSVLFLLCFAMFLLCFARFCCVLLCFCYVLLSSLLGALFTEFKEDNMSTLEKQYAHMLTVVAFLVVIFFFGFLIVTRHHDSFEGRHLVGILPTALPELSKPTFYRSNRRQTNIFGVKYSRSRKKMNDFPCERENTT